jgi:hypothetical protein
MQQLQRRLRVSSEIDVADPAGCDVSCWDIQRRRRNIVRGMLLSAAVPLRIAIPQ